MATNNNMTGSYCLSKKSHVSHHIIFITVCGYVLKMSAPARTQARRRWHHSTFTFNNRVTRSGPLAVDVSFQFVDVRDLDTIDLLLINVKEVTAF